MDPVCLLVIFVTIIIKMTIIFIKIIMATIIIIRNFSIDIFPKYKSHRDGANKYFSGLVKFARIRVKSLMPGLSVPRCQGVICQTSSKVDQLQAHPPNNGAGWGDRDPAPSAPLAGHLPPSFLSRCRKARAAVHTEHSSAKCNDSRPCFNLV